MQGGGQFHPTRTTVGLDDIQQRAHDEIAAAREAGQSQRGPARHRGGHASWLSLGRRKHPTAHAQGSAPAASGTGGNHGPGRGESRGR